MMLSGTIFDLNTVLESFNEDEFFKYLESFLKGRSFEINQGIDLGNFEKENIENETIRTTLNSYVMVEHTKDEVKKIHNGWMDISLLHTCLCDVVVDDNSAELGKVYIEPFEVCNDPMNESPFSLYVQHLNGCYQEIKLDELFNDSNNYEKAEKMLLQILDYKVIAQKSEEISLKNEVKNFYVCGVNCVPVEVDRNVKLNLEHLCLDHGHQFYTEELMYEYIASMKPELTKDFIKSKLVRIQIEDGKLTSNYQGNVFQEIKCDSLTWFICDLKFD